MDREDDEKMVKEMVGGGRSGEVGGRGGEKVREREKINRTRLYIMHAFCEKIDSTSVLFFSL